MGLSEFQTPLEVWQLIMEEREAGFNARRGYVLPPEPDSAALRWGSAFETAIINLSSEQKGCKIIDREAEYSCIDIGLRSNVAENYITCHIDGRYIDIGNLHEGKTTSAFAYRDKWGEPGTNKIPQVYQVQVQHQMLCTGANEDIVSVLIFPETPDKWEAAGWKIIKENEISYLLQKDNRITTPTAWSNVLRDMGYFQQYPCKANKEVQSMMVSEYSQFWQNHVITGKPPEPRNYDDIKRLIPESVGTVICDTQMAAWFMEYQQITKEIGKSGNAEKRRNKLRLKILNRTRKLQGVIDDESQDKIIFRDSQGRKLGQFGKGGFR